MDTLTPEERSERMSRIRGRDTKPEMIVRRIVHRMGYRYRLHVPNLPGKPDLVLPRHRKVIFVHGCFWHRHPFCKYATMPAERREFWLEKFGKNIVRDQRNLLALGQAGWTPLVIWECEIADAKVVYQRITSFLEWTRDEKACRARPPACRLEEKAGPSRAGRGAARP